MKTLKWNLNYPLPGEITRFILSQAVSYLEENTLSQIDEFINYSLTGF